MENDKLSLVKQRLESAEKSVASARKLLEDLMSGIGVDKDFSAERRAEGLSIDKEARMIEGVFDGESMIGPDKNRYPVPANYASKSKLIEGDILKLTIGADGSFVYKQIGPAERRKVVGKLEKIPGGAFQVVAPEGKFRVLLASVTYFQAEEGDEITLTIPKTAKSAWGAVENVIKAGISSGYDDTKRKNKERELKELEHSANESLSDRFENLDELDGLSKI